MRLLTKCKDGGPESHVNAYVLFEIKCLASVMLLRFDDGSREAYHDHAFNAISWLLRGDLLEQHRPKFGAFDVYRYTPSLRPIVTKRSTYHKVTSIGRSWALTLRGPWSKTWHEYEPGADRYSTLTHGRNPARD